MNIEEFKKKYPQAVRGTTDSGNATPSHSNEPENKKQSEKDTAQAVKQPSPRHNNELPADIAKDLNDYIYGNVDNYSDKVADYIDAEGLTPREKTSHALNLIGHLSNEFKKRPDKTQPNPLRIKRENLANFAMTVYSLYHKDDKVASKSDKLFKQLSNVATKDYMRYGKDWHIKNIQKLYNLQTEYADKLAKLHIQNVLDTIDLQKDKTAEEILQDKLKYARLLRRNKFERYIPEELAEKLHNQNNENQPNDKKSQPNKGDKPMNDEVKDNDSAPKKTEDTERKAPEFSLSKAEMWAANAAELKLEDYKTKDEILGKIADAGYIIAGDKVLKKGEGETQDVVAEYDKEKDAMIEKKKTEESTIDSKDAKDDMLGDDGLDLGDLPSKEDKLPAKNKDATALTVNPLENEETKEPPADKTWIQKKVENYQAMSAANKIGAFKINQGLEPEDKEFEVEFVEGGTIRYSSPDNVNISNDAKIKTFEAVMMENDNIGRPINFGENMPHDMAVRLAAACVLHGNKMIGNVPELTPEDMQLLKNELGDRFGEFEKKLAEQNKPEKEHTAEKKSTEDKTPKVIEEKPAEEKVKLSTAEELGKAAENLKGIKEQFEQMKKDGLIAVSTNLETKKPEIVAGPSLKDKPQEEQKKVVADANALIASAAAIVQSSKTLSGKLNEEQAKQNNAFNEERLQYIRDNMNQKKLAEHDALKTPEARKQRLDEMHKDMATKLGIIAPEGENKPLKGEARDNYIKDNGINKYTYQNLHNKFNKDAEGKPLPMSDAQKAVFDKLPEAPKMERGNSRE
ncbi:MAG: hypothetical protein IJ218_02320 [Alphaproteobacteria bacterium]|nr:hypothetical protein [Alphaproteobacteria bacterium]